MADKKTPKAGPDEADRISLEQVLLKESRRTVPLGKLRLGMIDGKHEYLVPKSSRDQFLFDAFLIPSSIDINRLNNSEKCFIEGFRGTGKTSLLRWHAERNRKAGTHVEFILFKSDLTEPERLQISREVGIVWTDVDSSKMEMSQDFKNAWLWFILHKLGEAIRDNVN